MTASGTAYGRLETELRTKRDAGRKLLHYNLGLLGNLRKGLRAIEILRTR